MAHISQIQNGESMTLRQQLALTAKLSGPAIMAQLSTILMQYIDASMVGRLGADQSASVGLMNSSLWMFWGVCSMLTMGFSVQVAHRLGAKDTDGARAVLRQGIVACLIAGTVISLFGLSIAGQLPIWLGAESSICHGATVYFATFISALPILILNYLAGGMLRCAGNMKIPGLLSVCMCLLDIIFNFFLIFPTREITLSGLQINIPGFDMGVRGAALGTGLAMLVSTIFLAAYLWHVNSELNLRSINGHWRPRRETVRRAFMLGYPIGIERIINCSAQITLTIIVAPLGAAAIAANAFAVTAEGLCYMPGFGIADAATTMTGQGIGAGERTLARRFAYITVIMGVAVMSVMGLVMYIGAPAIIGIMTPDAEIVNLGVMALRIEAWAEPMYAASIVAYGAFVGVGDTLLPAVMNFGSIWLVRIPLAALMAPQMGLRGVWIAMCIELVFRGIIFLWRMRTGHWLKIESKKKNAYVDPEGEAWLDND